MKISFIEIQNFRKLKSCRMEFADKETIFVGANNSGKTSAMDALILFLDKGQRKSIVTTDFTLSNWAVINKIADTWVRTDNKTALNLSIDQWRPYLPAVDVWLNVNEDQIHYVSHLIPTLDWQGGLLGVRLCFEPKNVENLYKDYSQAFTESQNLLKSKDEEKTKINIWPSSMQDFLDKKLHLYFKMKSFLIDPKRCCDPKDGISQPQILPADLPELEKDPFEGLIKINSINAQRGFSDVNSFEGIEGYKGNKLSAQLSSYYKKHLDPSDSPGIEDLYVLEAIENTRITFDERLRDGFKVAISELEGLGYPGFSDPSLILTSKVNPVDLLNHDAAVRFVIGKNDESTNNIMHLPEKYNGLGYQNLISMIFNLIQFRDAWMCVGKYRKSAEDDGKFIEPLHLVLIEEPEAHLHAQVQQVFIKKAFSVLRNHSNLKTSRNFNTQLIVSTHSSHIAHEVDFSCLRYFRKNPSQAKKDVPNACVINLSTTFGNQDETSRFAARYLKTTHCDLFFADAVILVEGPAERVLLPHFIRHKHQNLDSRYISILEIGGSHAHRLKPLIETLGLYTLVITDIDSIGQSDSKKVLPEKNKGYRTGNDTLKTWLPKKESLDDLYACKDTDKESDNGKVRICYQTPINLNSTEALPYTFEDSLTLSNKAFIEGINSTTGLLDKMKQALTKIDISEICKEMFEALESGKKAEMALELLFHKDPKEIEVPKYIAEGLKWLEDNLRQKDLDYLITGESNESCK
ncbi:MAG: AAA family ATPase [Spirochaetales bacterium]|nr:AAA family ATPase [Spirochaetales bacterium]